MIHNPSTWLYYVICSFLNISDKEFRARKYKYYSAETLNKILSS